MKNKNILIEDDNYIVLFLQLLNVIIIILLIYIAYKFLKKVWLFLNKAIQYLDKKNTPNE